MTGTENADNTNEMKNGASPEAGAFVLQKKEDS